MLIERPYGLMDRYAVRLRAGLTRPATFSRFSRGVIRTLFNPGTKAPGAARGGDLHGLRLSVAFQKECFAHHLTQELKHRVPLGVGAYTVCEFQSLFKKSASHTI